jgi:hypothetical protein
VKEYRETEAVKGKEPIERTVRTPGELRGILAESLILEVRHQDDGLFVRTGNLHLDRPNGNRKASFSYWLFTGDPGNPELATFEDLAGLSLPAAAAWFMGRAGAPVTVSRIAGVWGDNLWSGGKALASPWTALGRVLPESEFRPALDLLMGSRGESMGAACPCRCNLGKSVSRSQMLSYFLTSCWTQISRYCRSAIKSGIITQADYWPDPPDWSARVHPHYERVLSLLEAFADHPGAPVALRQADRGPMENTTWSIVRQVAASGDEGLATDIGAGFRWLLANGYPTEVSPIALPPDPRVTDLMRRFSVMEKFIPGLATNSLRNSPPVFNGHLRRYGFADIEELRDWLQETSRRERAKAALHDSRSPEPGLDETPIL